MKNSVKALIGRLENFTKLKHLLLILLLLISNLISAQSKGSISGKVKDESNNDVLIGANVLIVGTNIGASTDLDGNYVIKGLEPGEYSIKVSYISYNSVTVEKVKVLAGKDTKINVTLKPVATQIEEVVIAAEMIKSTEGALLTIQKNSLNIVDGVSAELISKNNSSDGTDILSRMTGITISDGKYAFVRGIGDRYNNTMLNGAGLPSTDPEKKSFSYDLFPASLIENVLTSKTFTADKPADFSGGLVEINTIEFPSNFLLEFSYSGSYNNRSTFKDFNTYNGGGKDYLGWDDGTRGMPGLIGEKPVLRGNYSVTELNEIGKSFANNWNTKKGKAPLNGSYKLNIGDKFLLGETVLGYIASLNYSSSVKSNLIEKNNYTFEGPRYTYKGSTATKSVMWGALLNLSLKVDNNNKISLKNIYNQNADDETINYQGAYYYNPDYRNVTSLRYVSRSLYSTQFIGEHHLNWLNGIHLNYNLNISESKRNEPDARRYVYVRDLEDTEAQPTFLLDQSLATRFFGDLTDKNKGAGFDLLFKLFENPFMPNLKVGFVYDKKDRAFNARTFGFKNIPGGNFMKEQEILLKPVEQIFVPENFGDNFIEIVEVTKPADSYKSYQNVAGTYLMTEFRPIEDLKVVTGVRYEYSLQHLNSKNLQGEPIEVNSKYNDVLPTINTTYILNETMNIRAAISRTLARPEFRELAPFTYFDFLTNELVQGNTELKRALITNYDLRYEYYPQPGELLAVGLFYKKFKDPIEQVLKASSGFEPIRSYQNANSAENYGLEVELRKSLAGITSFLDGLMFVGNVSFIKSKIHLNVSGFEQASRPLQGQADFILNLGLYYDEPYTGISSSIIYNKVGDRIAKVGFNNLGNVIEKSRDQIDLAISKTLFNSLKIKFAAKDILAQDKVMIQKSPSGDKIAERIKVGTDYSLGLSYEL